MSTAIESAKPAAAVASSAPQAPVDIDSSFQVPWSVHILSGWTASLPWLWKALGRLETTTVESQLSQQIDRPIYISGIARSGSTILLEILAAHAAVGSHQYADFPMLYTPVWWQQATARQRQAALPVERAHGDGIMVTPQSPEAMEEVLWMGFFPDIHDSTRCQILNRQTTNPGFESFYRDHLRKLLFVRNKSRYASKGNYNVARLPYLQTMFADARFIIPIRHPVQHIASLMKQHRLFVEGETRFPRALSHMQRVGHFEFGLDRRPIHIGQEQTIHQINALWANADEVRGWARYWNMIYAWLGNQIDHDDQLRRSTIVVRYEDLCADPAFELRHLLDHCELDVDRNVMAFESQIHAPTYYKPKFTDEELRIIAAETATACERFGYEPLLPS